MKQVKSSSDNTCFRENTPFYIPATQAEIADMLQAVGCKELSDLFVYISQDVRFAKFDNIPKPLTQQDARQQLESIAQKNHIKPSFLGDTLPQYKTHTILESICSIRPLTTAYTPYQPERSQGTLIAQWIYQCMLAKITGFEAINSSLYDRSTALFEAVTTALRLSEDKKDTVILSESLLPCDREVVQTHAAYTALRLVIAPLNPQTGLTDHAALEQLLETYQERLAAVAFPQVNSLGLLEDVDYLTNITHQHNAYAIASIDPVLLATDGLKPPSVFGNSGADIIVGEGQHLAWGPGFGGPGLGIFGVRYNEKIKTHIRATPGRFVGKAKDIQGRESYVMVLSTREQHIRKEKANSNICSNQAFIATTVGAALLERGEEGFSQMCQEGYIKARNTLQMLLQVKGVRLAFPKSYFYNECVIEVDCDVDTLIQECSTHGMHIGVDVSDRVKGNRQLLKISFSDLQTESDCARLVALFEQKWGLVKTETAQMEVDKIAEIPVRYLRQGTIGLPKFSADVVIGYYKQLGELNMSPDEGCYPLGSCTMKYNPYLNDWAANLKGFTQAHPQAPQSDVQGSLEILYAIQEWFKGIAGLDAVTTQPVAGAQGELVGLKLFQAYHHDRGEGHRNVVFIPSSAHGTNFATAAMAGFTQAGGEIVLLAANMLGQIDWDDFQQKLNQYGSRLCGVMITNPNTYGIFEMQFKAIADKVHQAGGLVYMDGANMNAIAGWVNLKSLGVDAVHNNLHKTWTIPHGGGGPGDAIIAVSERLRDYLPGYQIIKNGQGQYVTIKPAKSIGSVHRNWGNFLHKVRCYSYLLCLGNEGVRMMSAVAVLASRYLIERLKAAYPLLPEVGNQQTPRMHEFIITLPKDVFAKLETLGFSKTAIITSLGKMFLDFGFHAPTVAWPEQLGLMIEPTESYTQAELDRLADAVLSMFHLIQQVPEILKHTPLFTPVRRIDEVTANRQIMVSENLTQLPQLHLAEVNLSNLHHWPVEIIHEKIILYLQENTLILSKE